MVQFEYNPEAFGGEVPPPNSPSKPLTYGQDEDWRALLK